MRCKRRFCAMVLAAWLTVCGPAARGESLTNEQQFNAYYTLSAISLTGSRYEEALTHVERCLAMADVLNADLEGDLMLKKGIALIGLGRGEEALACLDRCLALAPATGDALLLRMQLYVSKGEAEMAFDQAEAYRQIAPTQHAIYSTLGELFAVSGDYSNAIRAYSLYLEQVPKGDALAYQMRGQYLLQAGRYEEAIADLTASLEMSEAPTVRGHYLRAVSLMQTGRYEEALADFDVCVAAIEKENGQEAGQTAVDEDVRMSRYYRGIARMQLKRYEEAIGDFNGCVQDDVNAMYARFWRGACYLDTGAYELAQQDYEACIEKNVETNSSLYYVGLCRMGSGAYAEAIEFFTQCIDRDIMKSQSLYNRGMCYLELGQTEQSEADLALSLGATE